MRAWNGWFRTQRTDCSSTDDSTAEVRYTRVINDKPLFFSSFPIIGG